MQSAVLGPTSGPMQKLWTITMQDNQNNPLQTTLVGVSATGLSVILITPPPGGRTYGQYAVTVSQNALPLWPQPQPLNHQACQSGQGGCNVSVAFDDAFIYVAAT
jgi:hypothetical protein